MLDETQPKQMKMTREISKWAFCLLGLIASLGMGCSYGFQTSRSILFEREGIRKIYISPIGNSTYKAGIENVVYNNLVRALSASGRVLLVRNAADADAILGGSVSGASYNSNVGTQVRNLNPAGLGGGIATRDYVVASEYMANLSCAFSLDRVKTKPGKKPRIWATGFTRSKPFPAANQLDVPGTTSPLINESEFDRALTDLARSMMDDVQESVLSMF
jgi:hypothetical protein